MDGLQILSIVFGFAGLAGGSAGYFAKSRGDTIIALQGKEIDYWKDRSGTLEKDNAALTAERDSLKIQNEGLIKRVQASPQLVKLTKEISKLVSLIEKNGHGKS